MSSRDRHAHPEGLSLEQDDLDHLFRWGLQGLVGAATPPVQIWQRIERQLRAGPSPARHPSRRSGWRRASLAQALALISLLALLGLNLSSGFLWSSYLYDGNERGTLTHTPTVWRGEGIPLLGDEGLLDGRQARLLAQELMRERRVIARDTAPGEDPILKYRHGWPREEGEP